MAQASSDSRTYSHNDFPKVDDVRPVGEDDLPCFAEVRDVLERHGKLERFGLALLHKHFDLTDGEILLEETDVASRRQTLRPVAINELKIDQSIETLFSLVDIEGQLRCYKTCVVSGTSSHSASHGKTGDGTCTK